MQLEESGIVVEVRQKTALVRLQRSSACGGCASAGQCHAGGGENEQLLEASNEAGAAVGDAVRVAVSVRSVISASARNWLLPLVGLLSGAAMTQLVAGAFFSPLAGNNAAGIGGIVGAVCAMLAARRLGRRTGNGAATLPAITRVFPNPRVTRG